jgi:hypothetical protein
MVFWLKSKGKGYQTRIKLILRDAMLQEIRRAKLLRAKTKTPPFNYCSGGVF